MKKTRSGTVTNNIYVDGCHIKTIHGPSSIFKQNFIVPLDDGSEIKFSEKIPKSQENDLFISKGEILDVIKFERNMFYIGGSETYKLRHLKFRVLNVIYRYDDSN